LRIKRFLAVLGARNKEFIRDTSALSWNFLFPFLIVVGFAFAFSGTPPAQYKVGVYGDAHNAQTDFFSTEHIQFIPVAALDAAIVKVERHQLDMLIDARDRRFWINDSSPKGYILERVLHGTAQGSASFTKATVSGREIRYVDWLMPGVLAMNMMFSALFGIGYVIVRYRKNGVLKRLKATPVTALEFLGAQVVSRVWLIMAVVVLVYIGTNFFIHFTMRGSYVNLFLVFLLGAVSLISLALLIAARLKSEELAGGLLNAASWPMMFLSGVWFSTDGLHPLLQKLAMIFPLTHVIDAARAIMIDGADLAAISSQLLILTLMSAIFMALGALTFRWN
jgi:ABC-2 type transport system permease protein